MRIKNHGIMLCFLLSVMLAQAAFAATFSTTFVSTTASPETSPYITQLVTSFNPTPTISVPSLSICTGTATVVTYTASDNLNFLSGQTNSNTNAPKIVPSTGTNSPGPFSIYWLTTTQSNYLHTVQSSGSPVAPGELWYNWATANNWQTVLNGASPVVAYSTDEYTFGIKYDQSQFYLSNCASSCTGACDANGFCYTWYGGGADYKSYVRLFCNANADVSVSSGGGSTSQPWLGSTLYSHFTLPDGTYTITGSLDISRCMSQIRNDYNNTPKDVRILLNDSYAPTFSSNSLVVTVQDPYSCSNLTVWNLTTSPSGNFTTGEAVSFSFTITNSGSMPYQVTGITSHMGVVPMMLVYTPNPPFTIPAGGSQTVTGTFTEPATSGNYTVSFNVFGSTVGNQCNTNSPLTCADVINQSMTVNGWQITCGFVDSNFTGGEFYPGQSALVYANCSSGGVQVYPCPLLNWSVNGPVAAWSSLNQSQTPPPPDSVLNYTVSPSAPVPPVLNGSINIVCADPSLCGNTSCPDLSNISIWPIPSNCTMTTPHPPIFVPNDSGNFTTNCYTSLMFLTICPTFNWTTNITNGFLNPTNTPQMGGPSSNFTTVSAPWPQTGTVNSTSTDPTVPLNCSSGLLTVSPFFGVDYDLTAAPLPPVYVSPGPIINITTTTTNVGNQNAVNTTFISATFPAGDCDGGCTNGALCTSSGSTWTYSSILPIGVGNSTSFNNFYCTCHASGLFNVILSVNWPSPLQSEYDYTNNVANVTAACITSNVVMSCPDYV